MKTTYCSLISVCGVLDGVDEALLPKLEKLNAKAARYKPAGGEMQFLQVFASKHPKGIHLHFDVMEAEYFRYMRSVPVQAKKRDIEELLSLIEGHQLSSDVMARFEVPSNLVQKSIAVVHEIKALNEGPLKATARTLTMEFRFENAPVEYLRTVILTDTLTGVEASLPMKLEIKGEYLVKAFDHANGFFRAVILGQKTNGENQEVKRPPAIQS